MTGSSGEAAIIHVWDAARLRDYFLRLGAEAYVDEGAVRVHHVGDGSDDDTISAYLRNWVDRNHLFASIQLDPPPAAPREDSRAELTPAAPQAATFERPRLGDLLQARGLISKEQLDSALVEARATDDLLGRVLIRRHLIYGDELARTLADQLDLPYVNLRVVGYQRAVASLLPGKIGMQFGVLPIARLGGQVRCAFADPLHDRAKSTVEAFVGDFTIVVADLLEIELAWKSVDPGCVRSTAVSM